VLFLDQGVQRLRITESTYKIELYISSNTSLQSCVFAIAAQNNRFSVRKPLVPMLAAAVAR